MDNRSNDPVFIPAREVELGAQTAVVRSGRAALAVAGSVSWRLCVFPLLGVLLAGLARVRRGEDLPDRAVRYAVLALVALGAAAPGSGL